MTRPTRLLVLVGSLAGLVAGALGGCLSVPPSDQPMCSSASDCDSSNGEVCEQGVCWGNPPMGTFAAIAAPPSTRHDLVPGELPQLALPSDGWMGTIALAKASQLGGRLVAYCAPTMPGCDATALGATITVSRRSQFQGGPGFQAVVNVDSDAESFAIPVPMTGPHDDPYVVTIMPDATQPPGGGQSAAQRVPPLRTQVSVFSGTNLAFQLGGAALPTITGHVTNALGQGLADYRVVALGRWDPTEAVTEVSTVAYTDATGKYAVTLSAALVGTVELVARPRPGAPNQSPSFAATIHLGDVDATASSTHDAALPASLGAPVPVPVQVQGFTPNGELVSALGAIVSVSGTLSTATASFTYSDSQVIGKDELAHLTLLDGAGLAGAYTISITPPASSTMSAVFAQKLALPVTAPFRLRSRIALRGEVRDANGKALKDVAMTARPSLRFLWSLEPAQQAFVEAIPAATAVTKDDGFVLYVDAAIDGTWGHYDLMIEPPTTSLAPPYTRTDADFPDQTSLTAFDLGTIQLPSAAYVHGQLTDTLGQPIENAELKLYSVDTQLTLCSEVDHAPSSCPIPAQIEGRSTSDSKGNVRIVLPR